MITKGTLREAKKGESNETKRELTKNNCSNLWKRTENITCNSVVLYLTSFTKNRMIFLKFSTSTTNAKNATTFPALTA